ncbi:hypothetical protein KNE206_54690 [Kitasatospora sp. NE20-6]
MHLPCPTLAGTGGQPTWPGVRAVTVTALGRSCPETVPTEPGRTWHPATASWRRRAAVPHGDRQADRALHTIVLVRMRHDPRTRDYVARRTREGLKTKDIFRCLKRFVAREVYHHLTSAFSGTPGSSPTA